MRKRQLFAISFLSTMALICGLAYLHSRGPKLKNVGVGVMVTSQVEPADLRSLPSVRTLIDLRPDGEDAAQPPSTAMQEAAQRLGWSFYYIPVPHEQIPESAVQALQQALAESPQPQLLYCRTGRRAVRTLALAQASTKGGPSVPSILFMARRAGFAADDLAPEITARVDRRNAPAEDTH